MGKPRPDITGSSLRRSFCRAEVELGRTTFLYMAIENLQPELASFRVTE